MAFDPVSFQQAVQPEAIEPGFLDHDNLDRLADPPFGLLPKPGEQIEQRAPVAGTHRSLGHLLLTYPFTSPRQAGSGMEIWGRLLRALASRLVMYCHGSMPRRRQVSNTLRVAA